jgi:hypothetical protein
MDNGVLDVKENVKDGFIRVALRWLKKPMKNFPMTHPRHGPAKERIVRHCLTSKV